MRGLLSAAFGRLAANRAEVPLQGARYARVTADDWQPRDRRRYRVRGNLGAGRRDTCTSSDFGTVKNR